MFTGIVEEVGTVKNKTSINGGYRFSIEAEIVMEDLRTGDSINVEGVCQTVVELSIGVFSIESVGETLEKTTIGYLQPNQKVNLERPLSPSSRMGGHFVQGHVNGTANITQWYPRGENYFLEVELPHSLSKYAILEGSIALDGISLTIAHLNENRVSVNIIPHTVRHTSLQFKNVGDAMNVEVDMIAKYIEKLLNPNKISESLNPENLKKWGY